MNWLSIGIGVAALGYGIYTAFARRSSPGSFSKLESMKKAWGEGPGNTVHVMAYTVIPILVGLVALYLGVNGMSFF
jgi:hypothetical protein